MQYLLILIILSEPAFGGNQQEAITQSQKALYAYPEVRTALKKTEVFAYGQLGLTPDQAKYLLLAAPLVEGKISTKRIKNMNFKDEGLNIRPNVEYDIRSKEMRSTANLDFSF